MKYILILWGIGFALTAFYACLNWVEWKRREGKKQLSHEIKSPVYSG